MHFNRLQTLLVALLAALLPSITVPAQPSLPQLGMDARIERGSLGCGATYYIITNPVQKGYAQMALVQQGLPLSPAKLAALDKSFLSRMGLDPGQQGFLVQQGGNSVYRFTDIPIYRPQVLDSLLLYSFERMAEEQVPQAIIVSGDLDATELKKKMSVFSMLVSRLPQPAASHPYQWQPRPAPVVELLEGGPAHVKVAYSGARIPRDYMNTSQAIVTDLFSMEFRILLEHRLKQNLREANIPYSSIEFFSRRSADQADDEQYAVQVSVAPGDLNATLDILSRTVAEMDRFGVSPEEFYQSKQVLLPSVRRRAQEIPSADDYVHRCIGNFLYGAQLAPYTEPLRYFARKKLSDEVETRFFNEYADALLNPLENLTLELGPVAPHDTTDTVGDALFRYFEPYLEASRTPSGKQYLWHLADTVGLEVNATKVKIKSEKVEPVTGGTLWTFSNGMRVAYKQVKGCGMFNYALLLNGGLAQIGKLKEGEGGYMGDLLSLYDVAGLQAWAFRDMLEGNGIGMETQVALNSMVISGDAPSGKLHLLLKALLAVANDREPNEREWNYYLRSQQIAPLSVGATLGSHLAPGFTYSARKLPGALSKETLQKANHYYDDRFSRMSDGILILSGDLDQAAVKRHLTKYLGAFRTSHAVTPRKPVEYYPHSGTITLTGKEGPKGLYVLMDAGYAFTAESYYTAQIATEALNQSLVRHLATHAFSARVEVNYRVQPQERYQILITCLPVSPEADPHRALTAIRAAIKEAALTPVPDSDIEAWKARELDHTGQVLSSGAGFVTTLVARYAANKDITSRYPQSIGGITSTKVCEFLGTLASGGRIEYIVP